MTIRCPDCHRPFKTQVACDTHGKAKHPKQVQARVLAATLPIRKNRMGVLFMGVIGGILGALLFLVGAVAIAKQGKALEISSKGVITLNPWVTTVHKR